MGENLATNYFYNLDNIFSNYANKFRKTKIYALIIFIIDINFHSIFLQDNFHSILVLFDPSNTLK